MRILITGANRGIGQELMSQYQSRGDTVLGTARSTSDTLLPLDVTSPSSFEGLSDRLSDQAIDLLVCNAGVYLDKGHAIGAGYDPQVWADTFAANVTGVYLTVEALLPHLRRSSAPKIAIISSIMASAARAPGGSYVYRASKAAVLNLGRNLATDLKSQGIAVGIYHPGWVRTDMGSQEADIEVDEAAHGLIQRFDALSLESSGAFLSYDGSAIAF